MSIGKNPGRANRPSGHSPISSRFRARARFRVHFRAEFAHGEESRGREVQTRLARAFRRGPECGPRAARMQTRIRTARGPDASKRERPLLNRDRRRPGRPAGQDLADAAEDPARRTRKALHSVRPREARLDTRRTPSQSAPPLRTHATRSAHNPDAATRSARIQARATLSPDAPQRTPLARTRRGPNALPTRIRHASNAIPTRIQCGSNTHNPSSKYFFQGLPIPMQPC